MQLLHFPPCCRKLSWTPEQRLMVETMLKSSNLLDTLINDVLDLSRLEDGRLQLEKGTFNLYSVFREVLNLIKPIASAKNSLTPNPEPAAARRPVVVAAICDTSTSFSFRIADPVSSLLWLGNRPEQAKKRIKASDMSSDEFSSEFERQRYLFYHVHNTDPFGHYKPYFGLPTRYEADRRDKTVIMLAKYAVDKFNIAEGNCLEFIRVVNVSYTLNRGRWYYITLRASDCRLYRAQVHHRTAAG
ncbi:hypothetical protein TIFTF001_039370 [Ficus carica]|uniref:Uncharacterized protein n=1 Tax=Ficus carica TaxID=3494 RepID=A0AA88JF16_FICCA|nr:hypothetical protein TIFTF001_039370 [Ficus carica]